MGWIAAGLAAWFACAPEPAPPPPVEPVAPSATGVTAAVSPSVQDVPLNALRFRLVFPEPMALAPARATIRDATGTIVPGAIRELRWNEDVRVLRIEPTGLEAGRSYVLEVDGLAAADGRAAAPVRHPFVARPEDHTPPDGKRVRVEGRPVAGSEEALRVRFPEPMSFESLAAITVLVDGSPWEGRLSYEPGDTVARFEPVAPWPDASVHVALGAGLSDLAGNELVDRPIEKLVPAAPPR